MQGFDVAPMIVLISSFQVVNISFIFVDVELYIYIVKPVHGNREK